jgi:hypothetical protein
MERENAINKIRQMLNRTVENGCSEGEAMNAAEKVGQLLQVYNLTMDQIFISEGKCQTIYISTGQKNRHPIDPCMVGIASFCDCKVWFSGGRYRDESQYGIFGMETDTLMVQYLYGIIKQAIDNETENFKRSPEYVNDSYARKRKTVSFQKGMSRRICARLNEMTGKRHREESIQSTNVGKFDMLIKKNKVQDEFDKLDMRLGKASRPQYAYDYAAFISGQMAGNRVNLNRPIEGKAVGYLE